MEKLAFVIPVYIFNENGVSFLEKTIEGIENQKDSDWIAIFVNDHSPVDGISNILEKYAQKDNRIHWLELRERVSTGSCRNIGIEWAKRHGATVILFNDADDISHPNRVKVTREIFERNPEVKVLYSGFEVIDEYNKLVPLDCLSPAIIEILDSIKNPPQGKDCWYTIGIHCGYTNITSATSVRTNLAVEEPFPDEYVSEDMHTWLRYFTYGEVLYADLIPTLYRIPSYEKRQSSNRYVKDYNETKMRVDIDGFLKALNKKREVVNITNEVNDLIEVQFYLKLAESMGNVGRLDLAYSIMIKAKNKINKYNFLNDSKFNEMEESK